LNERTKRKREGRRRKEEEKIGEMSPLSNPSIRVYKMGDCIQPPKKI